MSSTTSAIALDVAPIPRLLWAETRAKLLARLRAPAFSVLSIVLPTMFFALFFGIFSNQKGAPVRELASYFLAAYATYGVANVMVFNFGIGIANERGQKQDVLQRATPLPPAVAAGAQVIFSLVFALVALAVLFVYGFVVGGVRLGADSWVWLTVRLLLGSFPMMGLGMAIGYSTSANAAPAVTNLIYLPMSFISGIFIPINQLPDAIQAVGKVLPLYHYSQLPLEIVGQNTENVQTAIIWLIGWTVVLFAVGLRFYRTDESRKFS
jgi:ABC-2 type transport system permease protein